MGRYWTPENPRQQFWGSTVVMIVGLSMAAGSAAVGWHAYLAQQLKKGEAAPGRVLEAKRTGDREYHVRYEFQAQGRTWQSEIFRLFLSSSDWEELQRTQQSTIRYLPLDPSTNCWESALPGLVLFRTMMCVMFGSLSAFTLAMASWGLRKSLTHLPG